MTKFLLIFNLIVLVACSKQEVAPSHYDIQIKNAYFETIDAVQLGTHHLGSIEVNGTSSTISITKNSYDFSCVTKSSLKISTKIEIQGLKKQLIIKLNEKGKVELE